MMRKHQIRETKKTDPKDKSILMGTFEPLIDFGTIIQQLIMVDIGPQFLGHISFEIQSTGEQLV